MDRSEGGFIIVDLYLAMLSTRCVRILLSLALVGALPWLAAAREEEPSRRSTPLVTLALTLGDNAPVAITVREGELATVQHAGLGFHVGLVPRLSDLSDGDVEIDVVAPPRRAGGPSERLYERVRGRLGFSSFTAAGGTAIEIEVRAIGDDASVDLPCRGSIASSSTTGKAPERSPQRMPVGGCCITCQGVQSCGCAVATACGTCCGCSFCQ